MVIYMVEVEDYDTSHIVGYFTSYTKAKSCCEYLNRTRHSEYDEFDWEIYSYDLNKTDYESLNKELDEKERIEFETRMKREREKDLAELARLKAKYEQN